jgi:hypothetical protein
LGSNLGLYSLDVNEMIEMAGGDFDVGNKTVTACSARTSSAMPGDVVDKS